MVSDSNENDWWFSLEAHWTCTVLVSVEIRKTIYLKLLFAILVSNPFGRCQFSSSDIVRGSTI